MPNPLQKFLIAPLKSGQESVVKPWLIANDAYQELRNAYVWRGRVKKRVGGRVMDQSQPEQEQQLFTRLRILIGTTDPITGNLAGTVPGSVYAIGQMFSIGDFTFTVNKLGTPANLLFVPGIAVSATYNTNTGAYAFVGAPTSRPVYFYPATPVMGIQLYNQIQINDEKTIAFDTQFSYEYQNGFGWQRSGGVPGLWSGSDSDFHWTTNWRGNDSSNYLMFVVNNNAPDGIQYFDGTDWHLMPPPIINNAGNTLLTSLMVTPFKDRLLFLGPKFQIGASQVTYSNAIIFSQPGSPFAANAFNTDVTGKGIFLVAPTKESIISCEFLKDRLIIFFENSTWELVFTNNTAFPYVFQKINTELGVESTHSIIAFDKVTMGMGSTGLHACSGVNVQRIDDLIPYTVFDIQNINNGPQRVYGIRDYYEELCYWTYPSSQAAYQGDDVYPNRILVYDYANKTWAFHDDSITALGYFYLQDNLLIWQNVTSTWQELTQTWSDGESDQLFRSILAGNQQGWTFIVQPDLVRNCMSLQITDITISGSQQFVTLTIINHNLPDESFIFIDNITSDNSNLENLLNGTIQQVDFVDENTINIIIPAPFADTYLGDGTVERVSEVSILTKEYNFFTDDGKYTFISHGDFYVDRTETGAATIDYYASSSTQSMILDGTATGALLGTSVLETSPYGLSPFEQSQERFWHRIYFQTLGETIQLAIYFTNAQMKDPEIVFVEFTLNAMLFYARSENSYF